MQQKRQAWCAHTMTARQGQNFFCCDCGRKFKDRREISKVQTFESETGFVMEIPEG